MDLKRLEYFVRVAELGSFTRAAAELGVVQPALSRQVRTLEGELRQELFVRNAEGVTLTVGGMRLLEHARGILHQVARAEEDLLRIDGALAGRVAVGLPPSMSAMLAIPLVREFRRRLPQAALSINEAFSFALHEWLMAGRLDIALLYDPLPSPELEVAVLMSETLYLVSRRGPGAEDSPVRLAAVGKLPLVLPARPNALRMLMESQLAQLGMRPRIAVELDAIKAIVEVVAQGEEHSVLGGYAVAALPQPERFTLRPIVQPALSRTLTAAIAAGRSVTLTQQAMREVIGAVARDVFRAAAPGRA